MKKISSITIILITTLAGLSYTQEPVPPSHPEHHLSFPECDEGFFYNHNSTQCEKCHHICKTCSGFKLNCDSCADGYYFDPLVKIHCLKEGPWHEKFHHLEEMFKHLAPPHFHFVPVSGLASYAFSMAFFMISIFVLYWICFCVCLYGKGVNINQIEIDEFVDLLCGKDLEEVRRKKQERMKRRYQEMGGSYQFTENTNQIV